MGRSGRHCLGTKDWANTREELAGCGLAHPPLEAGGSGEGKGGKLGPREGIPYQTANRLPISNQRLPEILDGWHLPGESQLEIAPQKRHKGALDQTHLGTEAGTGEGRSRAAPGESVLIKLLAAWAALMGKAQNPGPTESASLWSTREPELERLRPGKRTQLKARSLQSSQEPEQCRRGKHTRRERGQTQCGPDSAASTPHTRQWYLFVVPLPPYSTTEQANLNKRPPPPTCVRVEIRHWRDLQTEAK